MYRMVFTQVFCRLIAISAGLVMGASCSTYRILPIEIFEPGQVFVDSGKRIAYFDRNICYRSDKDFFLRAYDIPMRMDASENFFDGLKAGLSDNGHKDTLLYMQATSHTYPNEQTPEPIEPLQLREFFGQFKMDYIIVLEYHRFRRDTNSTKYKSEWFLRLYSEQDSVAIDSFTFKQDLREVLDADHNSAESDWNNGYRYAERIIPHWTRTVRRVYNKEKVLRVGDLFLRNGNIDQAFELWKAALSQPPKVALRASVNIAWLYENSGDFEMARQVLTEALQKAKEKNIVNEDAIYLNEYLKMIEKRILSEKKLNQQF